jgi:hypothetical protein
MFVLGSLREILGNGTLFDGADACWAAGRKFCVSKCSIPIRRSCWRCCRRARLLVRHDAGGKIPD